MSDNGTNDPPEWAQEIRRDIRSLAYSMMLFNDGLTSLMQREATARHIEESRTKLVDDRKNIEAVARRHTHSPEHHDTWPAPEAPEQE